MNMPPDLLHAFFTRKAIIEEIENKKLEGLDTTLLEAKLDYLEIELNTALDKTKGFNKKN